MEELTAAVRALTATVGSVKSTVDESQQILKDVVAWRPQVDGAMQEMRAEIVTLRQQLGRVALNPIRAWIPSRCGRSLRRRREGAATSVVGQLATMVLINFGGCRTR